MYPLATVLLIVCLLISCNSSSSVADKAPQVKVFYNDFEAPSSFHSGWERFDNQFKKDTNYLNDFELTKLVQAYPDTESPVSTLPTSSKMIKKEDLEVYFYPLQQDTSDQFQYVHKFNCVKDPVNYKYADVAYPNPCKGERKASAKTVFVNKTDAVQQLYCRMFYQNNSYAYLTNEKADFAAQNYLTNYYGATEVVMVVLQPNETLELDLNYRIGRDPKKEDIPYKNFYGPARPGAYEFMLWVTKDSSDILVNNQLDLKKVNPFANFQQRKTDGEAGLMDKIAHLNARHFKFIFHHETFNGDNIYDPGSIYLLGDRTEKKLCDTCTGYFKNVIADEWTPDDYFKGFIAQADWVKAEYGNRKENVRIDERGVLLKCPKSTENTKLKTWGELKFGPGFLYGTVKVVAKLAQLRNTKTHSPTGIIHNLWLYQFNHPYAEAIPGHPYEQYKNDKGKQPYEIDIEIWSKIYSENWSGGAGINYSIVDYMRNENAIVKPGEQKNINGNEIDRLNNVQLNYPDKNLYWHDFFEGYHLYEIIWKPASVQFKIDGRLVATITEQMAKIPDEYAFLWLGSPIYQDGTYYGQNQIPFLPDDRFSHIRYISID